MARRSRSSIGPPQSSCPSPRHRPPSSLEVVLRRPIAAGGGRVGPVIGRRAREIERKKAPLEERRKREKKTLNPRSERANRRVGAFPPTDIQILRVAISVCVCVFFHALPRLVTGQSNAIQPNPPELSCCGSLLLAFRVCGWWGWWIPPPPPPSPLTTHRKSRPARRYTTRTPPIHA